jgi:predicted MFS family arabinose efflux permease
VTSAGAARRRRLTVVAVMLACFTGQSFGRFSFGLLLPAMKADLSIGYDLAGWLGTINLAGYLVGTIATSVASLRVPAHRLLQIGTATATLGIGVLAVSTATPVLLLGMVLCGLGGAAAWVPAPQVAASVFPPERRGFAMGVTSGGIGLGIVLAVLLTNSTRAIAANDSLWRQIWLLEGLVGVLAIIATSAFLQPMVLANVAPPRLSALTGVPRWWSPTTAYVCFGFAYVMFATFVVAALQERSFTPTNATFVFAAFGAGNVVGALSVGRLSDRIGRRTTMAACYALCGVACASIIHGPRAGSFVLAFAFGLGMAGAVVSLAAYIGDHVSPQAFSAAFGAVTALFGISQTIGPRIGGGWIEAGMSFSTLFFIAAAVWCTGAVAALAMPRRTR